MFNVGLYLGHHLLHQQRDIPIDGWAMECRVYAEVKDLLEYTDMCPHCMLYTLSNVCY